MPRSRLVTASTQVLRQLDQIAHIVRPQSRYEALLRLLLHETEARGAWLELHSPAPLTLHVGAVDPEHLAWLQTRQSEHSQTEQSVQVCVRRHESTLLCLQLGRPTSSVGTLALDFCGERDLSPEECEMLGQLLTAVISGPERDDDLRETEQRLSRFELVYEVGQAIASTLDLDQVLKQSTARVAEVLGAEASTLMLVDEHRQELVFKILEGPAEHILREQRMPIEKGVAGWAAVHGQPVIIPDVAADDRFYQGIDHMTGYQTRTIMAVPLQTKGRTIGVVEVINKANGGSFTADDQQWLSVLAPLIAVAIDNARLFAEERQRVSELMAANTVAVAVNQTLDLPAILRSALLTTLTVLNADKGEVTLLDPHTLKPESYVQEGARVEACDQQADISCGLTAWVTEHRSPLALPDIGHDARAERLLRIYPAVRSYAGVPLMARGNITGILSIMSEQTNAFENTHLALLDTIGRQVAMAVENARLYVALREERDRIIAAEEKVRHELARNLHDGPAQIMAAIILNIDMARRHLTSKPEKMATELNFLESLALEANQEVRDLLFNMRPLPVETQGLTKGLLQWVERLDGHVPYQLHLDSSEEPEEHIDPKVAGTLFVIAQEALNNIQKHAHAENVWIKLGRSDSQLWLEVADDGKGFDVTEVDSRYDSLNSFGLLNMRERARLIEGRTRIVSPLPDGRSGTLVRVEVPLERARLSP